MVLKSLRLLPSLFLRPNLQNILPVRIYACLPPRRDVYNLKARAFSNKSGRLSAIESVSSSIIVPPEDLLNYITSVRISI